METCTSTELEVPVRILLGFVGAILRIFKNEGLGHWGVFCRAYMRVSIFSQEQTITAAAAAAAAEKQPSLLALLSS